MKHQETVELVKPARKGGGDRYESPGEEVKSPLIIYIPQRISRPKKGGAPLKIINITFGD